jgi:hypothetical protein
MRVKEETVKGYTGQDEVWEQNKDNKLDSTTNSKDVAGMLYEDIGGDDSQG